MMMMLFDWLRKFARTFAKDERGQAMVEYGLIIALVAVVLIVVLVGLSGGLNSIFTDATEALNDPGGAGG